VAQQLGTFITDDEINGLMARRDLIVAKLEGRGDGTTTPNAQTSTTSAKTSKK
jgi:hypothetical protein